MNRILHCIGILERGGAERQLHLLLEHFDPNEARMTVLCLDATGQDRLPSHIDVVTVERGPKWRLGILGRRIWEAIEELRPDLLHLWVPEIVTVPAALAGRGLGIPVIGGLRRAPAPISEGPLWVRDRLAYPGYMLADRLVANFDPVQGGASGLKAIFERKRGMIIPNAIETRTTVRQNREPTDGRAFRIAYAGRLVQQKRVGLLLEALSSLRDRGHDVRLEVYGDGPLMERLKEIARSSCQGGRVAFHGFTREWMNEVAEADLFVLPSVSEGMPNVLLEAGSMGLPIMAVKIPEVEAVFTHESNAWLVEPDSVDALTDGIEDLIGRPALRQRLAAGAVELASQFSVQAMIAAYRTLYSSFRT